MTNPKGNVGIKEKYRPGLRIKKETVERERNFNSEDPDRKKWMLDHTYLCRGNLKDLKKHPSWSSHLEDTIMTYYPTGERPREVVVRVKIGHGSRKFAMKEAEKSLKRALYLRDCNAGINYKICSKGNYMIGKAVPAIITEGF